jgi:hypothetical protein
MVTTIKRTLGFCDPERRIIQLAKIFIENCVKRLQDLELAEFTDIKIAMTHCDALIIAGPNTDAAPIPWLERLSQEFSSSRISIMTPVIVVSEWDFDQLNSLIQLVIDDNWYFDILHPDHLSSLPIRVANLIRINEHLREIETYDRLVNELENRVHKLETSLKGRS